MKTWLNNYFGFTKREYNGLLALMVFLLLISALPYIYTTFLIKPTVISNEEQAAIQKLILVSQQEPNYYAKMRSQVEDSEVNPTITLFKFDPNVIDVEDWQKLGLSIKQAQSIVNYRNKGGKFYKPEDLKKMYTISPKKYEQLVPYITIENTNTKYIKQEYAKQAPYIKKELVIVEINSADTLQLDEIKGIGAAFTRRIAKYRDKLGGFYKKEQLLEVFGLDSIKFNEIKDQIKIDANNLKKININTAEFDDLKNHPYLKYKQINAIIQYRKQHGKYNDIADLKKVAILTPQIIQTIAPYLIF
ncbi:helix-hairpin-helix domain-containing protein [Pedobacter boryungensis]|uniref:Helix-hairpin-helix domain-containing protein n=1 Tax=Pedobacter boryungensis TaxID=869962 RepID=A0ABX2DE39_9SPHI|nr:helix-hairpin-helix domain-containing protein [Pedobacter boryungensis]NQX32345.1 helix-hairpin-helix domain-containing protein [Pedobacter boryungensis]